MTDTYPCIIRENGESWIKNLSRQEALEQKTLNGLHEHFTADKLFLLEYLPRSQDLSAFHFIDKRLKQDLDILALALELCMISWNQVPEQFKHHKNLVMAAVMGDIENYPLLDQKFKTDKDFTQLLLNNKLKQHEINLLNNKPSDLSINTIEEFEKIKNGLRHHYHFIVELAHGECKPNIYKLSFILEHWGHDLDIMQKYIEIEPYFYSLVAHSLTENLDLFLKVYETKRDSAYITFKKLDKTIQNHIKYALETCTEYSETLLHLELDNPIWKSDNILTLLNQCSYSFKYMPADIKNNSFYAFYAFNSKSYKIDLTHELGPNLVERLNSIHPNFHFLEHNEILNSLEKLKIEDFVNQLDASLPHNNVINTTKKIKI